MATRLEIVIPEIEESLSVSLMRRIHKSLNELEALISNFDDSSEIHLINKSDVDVSTPVSEIVEEMLKRGIEYYHLTEGYFDFTLGMWTISKEREIRDNRSIQTLIDLPMDRRIALDSLGVRRLHSLLKIDSGGLGKGLAVELLEKLIREAGITSAFISFGGSSVCGIGSHPYGDAWKVGIEHPGGDGSLVGEVKLVDQTLSVSGNSANNRKKYGSEGHIINPRSAAYYSGEKLMAVVSDNAFEAEVLSTAMICADEESKDIISNRFDKCTIMQYDCGK